MRTDFTKKILRRAGVITICLFCWLHVVARPEKLVRGEVKGEDELPLPGVNITVKGTTTGTTTDVEGRFELHVPDPDAILVFSFIGYISKEIKLAGQTALSVSLEPDLQSLEEVVVVGYGQQRKSNITGAISIVKGAEIENRPVTRLDQALQGLVPGLNIANTNGQPGSQGVSMRIRGISTFSGNPVLTIIDGVPSSLDRVNPNDVESVSVLKDAAAAAIYGSRATGGVIIVTTKSGRSGPPRFNYSGIVSLQSPSRFAEKVSSLDHAILSNEARPTTGFLPNTAMPKLQKSCRRALRITTGKRR